MSNKSKEEIKYQSLKFSEEESLSRSSAFFDLMDKRRSVREFSDKPVSRKVIENIIMTASSAPSGANKQPWFFCVVSDPDTKKTIRKFAEEEEYKNYHGRMTESWLEDLKILKTDWNKPFIEKAPYIIVIFKKVYNEDKSTNYYVNESVGIAAGLFITAIHNAGLITLTHTPSPMGFLNKILDRPKNEKPYLLMPVGYPEEGAMVPNIKRKSLNDISKWI